MQLENEITVPVLEVLEQRIVCRFPEERRGQKFSVVSVSPCNFDCVYCAVEGNNKDPETQYLPNWEYRTLGELRNFVRQQVAKGNIVKITGGEPTHRSVRRPVQALLQDVDEAGGYACLDTNGSFPEVVAMMMQYIDQLAVDLKCSPRYLKQIVNAVSIVSGWRNPIQTIQEGVERGLAVEVRTVAFGMTTLEDLELIALQIPPKAYWLIRQFINTRVSQGGYYGINPTTPNDLESLPLDKLRQYGRELVKKIPSLSGRICLLYDDPTISTGEYL